MTKEEFSLRHKLYLGGVSLFFAILPTRVFIQISSDIIQISIITVPFVIAFMIVILSIDIAFGLPLPSDALEKISDRRSKFSTQLTSLLQTSLALILVTIIAKSLAVWLIDYGWLADVVNHCAAWIVGGMMALLLLRIGHIRDIFGYLSVGADLAMHVRANRETREL